MSTRIAWLMLTCTLLCLSCAKTRGVSLGSTSDVNGVDAGTDAGADDVDDDDDDDRFEDERPRPEDENDDDEMELDPLGTTMNTTLNSSAPR